MSVFIRMAVIFLALSLSEQLLYSTTRLICEKTDGSVSFGTGFFYRVIRDDKILPLIITNKHVVADAVSGRFCFTEASEDYMPLHQNHLPVQVSFSSRWINHPDPNVDLCCMCIGPEINGLISTGKNPFIVYFEHDTLADESFTQNLLALEEVVMVGYPIGIWDKVNNMPILRRGITATHPALDYEGKKMFLIDIAIFPGSSGSPVALVNEGQYVTKKGINVGTHRVKLLGVVNAMLQHETQGKIDIIDVPTTQVPVSQVHLPVNLGCVIKAERIAELDNLVAKHYHI